MRIIIDLQGRQSPGSKNRGIGIYSLSITKAIIRNKKDHIVIIVLSSAFPAEVKAVQDELSGLLPRENIHLWSCPDDTAYSTADIRHRKMAELSREVFLHSLNPDIIYIASLFEGHIDNVVTSICAIPSNIPIAVTLYDLIPLINKKPYLDDPNFKQWYLEKIEHLKRADLLLAISESSRQEALTYLNCKPDKVITIGTAADSQFTKIELSRSQKLNLLKKYQIKNGLLMYTGGIDHRKNIKGLIHAYSLLPTTLREHHQLVIVCSIDENQKSTLEAVVKQVGLDKNEVLFTGFIHEEDLIGLYNLCKAFVFPSLHEGFGLPVLEAMLCGAPVIAANTSSLPEVVGLEEALFNPHDDQAMAQKIEQVLTNESFRQKLRKNGAEQIRKFSWDISAQKAIKAFETVHQTAPKGLPKQKRPRLAYVSPLPPEKSGISDYSAELLPELYNYYDIDVVVNQETVSSQWIQNYCGIIDVQTFRNNSTDYDRVLYHFGNSKFHSYMFALLLEVPGVVVLHDFYLSGVISYMNTINYKDHSFEDELFYSHGNIPFNRDGYDLITEYPSNKKVLDYAKGIIVHSENSKKLAKEWYGKLYDYNWSLIPLLRKPFTVNNHNESRKKLNIPEDAIVIASFGHLYPTKLNIELLEAWLDSSISKNKNCYLMFVGESSSSNYDNTIQNTIASSPFSDRIRITGWTDIETFKDYLSAVDIGVQLRTLSRGETSAAVLDCMNYGLATIINANGSMADLPQDAVWMLPDKFSKIELVDAMETLYEDKNRRKTLGEKALNVIREKHAPDRCAKQYTQAIETYYTKNIVRKEGLVELKARATESEARATESEARATESERKANDALHHYHMATHSLSWKVTKPLRYLMKSIKSISGTKS